MQAPQIQPPKKKQFHGQNRRGNKIVASAQILGNDSAVVQADLYNEPIQARSFGTTNGYIPFFDNRNSFANELLALSNNSPTLRRCIQDKSAMVLGDGFNVFNGTVNPMLTFLRKLKTSLGFKDETIQHINNALLVVNKQNETLQDVLQKGIYDYNTLGNCFFELVTVDTSDGKKTYIYHIPVYMVAYQEMKEDYLLQGVGIKENWSNSTLTGNEKVRNVSLFPLVTEVKESDNSTTERTVIAMRNYAAGYTYWGLPDWIAAKSFAEIEYRTARFQVNELENSFIPSAIVTFIANMEKGEAETLLDKFKQSYTGTMGHKKVFGQVVLDEKYKTDVQILDQKRDGSFLDLLKISGQMIVTASRWTMSLAGFSDAGKLGSTQQIRSEIEILQNTVIKPIQNKFVQNVLQPYLNKLAETDKNFKNISLEFSNSMPISFLGELDVKLILTQDEQRAIAGYEPTTTTQTV